MADDLLQAAVQHELLIIGEATKRISRGFRADHPDVAWPQMAGMRDRLIHGYDVVRLEVVWSVMKVDLPPLVEQLQSLLRELGFEPPQ